MKAKEFDKLTNRDLENGAVRDEIYTALKKLDGLEKAAMERRVSGGCDCIDKINTALSEQETNTMLDIPIALNRSDGNNTLESVKRVKVVTTKRDTSKRKKPMQMFASYCPFCGEKYTE